MKLELVLTAKEQSTLKRRASHFGADVPSYIKFVLSQETGSLSAVALRRVREAWQMHKTKKTISGDSFEELCS